MKFKFKKKLSKNRPFKILFIIVVSVLVLIFFAAVAVRFWYVEQLKPKSNTSKLITVVIPSGYSTSQIATILQNQEVIKSAKAFEWYVRDNDLRESLKAGQYQLDSSSSVREIAQIITEGKIKVNLFTILPGQRLDQVKKALINAGYKAEAVEVALDSSNYKNHPIMIYKPADATLEGYLFPESFQTTSTSTPEDIIKMSLDEMAKAITPDLVDDFQNQGLSVHKAIILASIIEQEVSNAEDRRKVAGVFLNRLKINMVLGSDVTYHYAAALAGLEPNPFIDSPYNTRKYSGLPPGPISNVSLSSLLAVANPIKSDYLYFVAGDDGKTYFSKTVEEHEALAKEHCKILCSTY